MSDTVGSLRAVFTIDTKPLTAGLKVAAKEMSAFQKRYGNMTDVELGLNYKGFLADLKVAQRELDRTRRDFARGVDVNVNADGVTETITELETVKKVSDEVNGQNAKIDVNVKGGASSAAELAAVDAGAKALPNNVKMDVNVKTSGALARLAALDVAMTGSAGEGGVVGAMGSVASAAGPMGIAIAAAATVAVAALAPLMGGAAAAGSATAGVIGGFGLMFLAGKSAFGKLEQVNGKFVAKTAHDSHTAIATMATYINKVVASYQKAIQPASYAFASFATDVLKNINKIIPYMGKIATQTANKVHAAFNDTLKTMNQPREINSFKRITDAMPAMTANFTHALGNFGIGLGNILGQSTPLAKSLVHWFDRMSKDFLEWTRSKAGREEISKWLHDAAVIGPKVAYVIGAIAKGLIHISETHGAQVTLKTILDLMSAIAGKKGALKATFDDIFVATKKARASAPIWDKWGFAIHDAIGRAVKSVGSGTNSMLKHLNSFASQVASWTRKFDSSFTNYWENKIWQPASDFLVKKKEGWGHTLSNAMGNAVSWVKSYQPKVGKPWGNFWQDAANFLVKRKEGWGSTLSNAMGNAISWVKSFPGKVGKPWGNFWQNAADFLVKRKEGWGTTLSNAMSGAVNWVKSYDNRVGSPWNKFWQNTADFLMKRKDGWGQTLSNFMTSAVNWAKGFDGKVGTIWRKFWQGAANFVIKIKDGITQTMSNLVSTVESWWNKLIGFINKVLNAVGLDSIGTSGGGGGGGGGSSGGGGGGSSTPSIRPGGGTIIGHAKGGIHDREAFARGGLSGPHHPRMHLWGEGSYDEGFITTDPKYRKDNLYYLKAIASKLGQVVVPGNQKGGDFGGGGRAQSVISRGGLTKFGAGGLSDQQLATYKARGDEYLGDPYKYGTMGTFAGPGGASCSGLWAHIIYGRTGNQSYGTYSFAGGTPGMARGGGQLEVGVQLSGGGGVDGTHMAGDINGTSYESSIPAGVHHGLKAGNFPTIWHLGNAHAALRGSEAGSMSVWDSVGNAMWNRLVQPRVDRFVRNNSKGFALNRASAAVTANSATAIKNWIIGQTGGSSGGSFSGNGMQLMKESLKRDGLPSSWATNSSLWNIAKQESGTTPSHVVWTPAGPNYFAPWGMIEPNRYGVTDSSPQIDKFAVGPRYVKDQYGTPENAWRYHVANGWYSRGGIHNGAIKHRMRTLERGIGGITSGLTGIAGESGRESIVPLDRRTAEGMHALRAANSVHGGREIEEKLDRMTVALEKLEKHGFHLRNVEALAEFADHWQGSPGGARQWAKQFDKKLGKERKKVRAK